VPTFVILAHELTHGLEEASGKLIPRESFMDAGATPPSEAGVEKEENLIRKENNLPLRDSYISASPMTSIDAGRITGNRMDGSRLNQPQSPACSGAHCESTQWDF
jgi:hypothetical protein